MALVHHPVKNRHGEVIAASSDEYDYFDCSRLVLTYNLDHLYVVQPTPAQQDLVQRLIAHGVSTTRHGDRGCFERATVVESIAAARSHLKKRLDAMRILTIATTARDTPQTLSYAQAATLLHDQPGLLLFGKAWGLTDDVLHEADGVLSPIQGEGKYNHLSVRSAVAITLDRLHNRT